MDKEKDSFVVIAKCPFDIGAYANQKIPSLTLDLVGTERWTGLMIPVKMSLKSKIDRKDLK